jgi:protein TonB
MLFLAALVHGILILGINFTTSPPSRDPKVTSLDVVLVTRDYEKLAPPKDAVLLANQNLIGRGNAPLHTRLRATLPQGDDSAQPGPDQDGTLTPPEKIGTPDPAEARITAAARRNPTVRRGETGADVPVAAQRTLFTLDADPVEILADPDTRTSLPDANPRELLVSANTREARIAGYLNTWKVKVERIGTLNFPHAEEVSAARAYPVLEVAITANGELKDVVVRHSSGRRNLDQAAVQIVRMAAPFEPFPQSLQRNYDALRFAYEWRFGRGESSGRVRTIDGT